MSGRTWIPILSVPLGFPSKQLSISRGIPSDVKAGNTKITPLFSLQITVDYTNGFQASIPLLSEVVNVLKSHLEGTLSIPAYGYFLESDGKHYVILENKNKEITLSFERNKYRNTLRLTSDELETIIRFHRIKQFLFERTKPKSAVFCRERPDMHGQEMSLYIQVWTAFSLKTMHELGTCDCADVVEGWPCKLSATRSVADRFRELTQGVALYAEVLKNIQTFRDLLGMNIPFDGFSERLIQTAQDLSETDSTQNMDNDYSVFVRTVLKQ